MVKFIIEDLHVRGSILNIRFPLYCYTENQNLQEGVTEDLLALPTILIRIPQYSVHKISIYMFRDFTVFTKNGEMLAILSLYALIHLYLHYPCSYYEFHYIRY